MRIGKKINLAALSCGAAVVASVALVVSLSQPHESAPKVGTVMIHLGAYDSMEEAVLELYRVQSETEGDLSAFSSFVQPVSMEDRHYFRLLLFAFPNIEAASSVCAEFYSRWSLGCVPVTFRG